jgi:hypothetical protein
MGEKVTRKFKSGGLHLQSHKGSGGTKKQTKESNKTGFSPPTNKPIIVN